MSKNIPQFQKISVTLTSRKFRSSFQIDAEPILNAFSPSVYLIDVNNFPIEPDFYRIIAAYTQLKHSFARAVNGC